MDKIKNVAEKATRTWYKLSDEQKAKILKGFGFVINWVTKGKIKKDSILAVAGVLLGLNTLVGPNAIAPKLDAAQNKIEVLEEQIAQDSVVVAKAKTWFEIE